jgi:hypothetical protein
MTLKVQFGDQEAQTLNSLSSDNLLVLLKSLKDVPLLALLGVSSTALLGTLEFRVAAIILLTRLNASSNPENQCQTEPFKSVRRSSTEN